MLNILQKEKIMTNYYTVKQLAEKHPAFSEASLRYYIFHENTNGFNKVTRRVGKKILLSEEAFQKWLDSNGGKPKFDERGRKI